MALVVAFGTRGDVLPLLRVVRTTRIAGDIYFATHEAHRALVETYLPAHARFIRVPTGPWHAGGHPVSDDYEPILCALAGSARLELVIFNLFSLGAWHIDFS